MNNKPDLTRKDRKEESKEKVQRSEPTAALYNKYTICREIEKNILSTPSEPRTHIVSLLQVRQRVYLLAF